MMKAAETQSTPTDKNELLSSLEYRVSKIKVELSIPKVDNTSDECDLVLK